MKVAVIYGWREPATGDGGGLRQLAMKIRALDHAVQVFAWDDGRVLIEDFDVIIGHSYGGHQAIRAGNMLPNFVSAWIITLDPVPQHYWFMPWRLKAFEVDHHRVRNWVRKDPRLFPWPSQWVWSRKVLNDRALNRVLPPDMTHNSMRADPRLHEEIIAQVQRIQMLRYGAQSPSGVTTSKEEKYETNLRTDPTDIDGPGPIAEPEPQSEPESSGK